MTDPVMISYDEFSFFAENVAEFDLEVSATPRVRRVSSVVADGRTVSALQWGDGPTDVVFLHGGAQNAHTWDTVALALGRPALAVDLPGHGHSDWRGDGVYTPSALADDVAVAVREHAPDAAVVVGMSLGGLAAMELAVRHRQLVRRLAMVDITPGVNEEKAKAVIDFVDGPQEFASFDDLLARTMEFNPTRSQSSLRRGILHNARQSADGSWRWRYHRSGSTRTSAEADAHGARTSMWSDFESVRVPMTLVRGSSSPVVDDDDVAEAVRRQPTLDVRVVEGAGHSVQGDRPVELAAIVAELFGDD